MQLEVENERKQLEFEKNQEKLKREREQLELVIERKQLESMREQLKRDTASSAAPAYELKVEEDEAPTVVLVGMDSHRLQELKREDLEQDVEEEREMEEDEERGG